MKMTIALMGLAVIAPVSLQIVIERNVLTEKCLSSHSVKDLCLSKGAC